MERLRRSQGEFAKREVALQRATALRNSMPLLDVNVADDLQKMREERLDQIAPTKQRPPGWSSSHLLPR